MGELGRAVHRTREEFFIELIENEEAKITQLYAELEAFIESKLTGTDIPEREELMQNIVGASVYRPEDIPRIIYHLSITEYNKKRKEHRKKEIAKLREIQNDPYAYVAKQNNGKRKDGSTEMNYWRFTIDKDRAWVRSRVDMIRDRNDRIVNLQEAMGNLPSREKKEGEEGVEESP